MPWSVIGGLTVSLIFFLIIPLSAAFVVRERWRRFRAAMLTRSTWPVPGPGDLPPPSSSLLAVVHGHLEGMEGNHLWWIRSGTTSFRFDDRQGQASILVERDIDIEALRVPVRPRSLGPGDSGILPEGMGVMLAGLLTHEADGLWVRPGEGGKPVMVFYEGAPETVFPRLIWSGRQQNEFWNLVTPVSLLAGFGLDALLVLASLAETANRLWPVLLASWAVIPFLVLLPPGIFGFVHYRNRWRSGRYLRALRDLGECWEGNKDILRRVLESFGINAAKPGDLGRKVRWYEAGAVLVFLLSLGVNWSLVFLLFVQLARG